MESSIAFVPGAVHEFRFTTVSARSLQVSARATYCHAIRTSSGGTRYRAGFEFILEPRSGTVRAIEILLNAAASSLGFE